MSVPVISIIMPVFNAEQFLPQSLSSILSQANSDVEVIVVNDGSSDNSDSLIKERFHPYIESHQLTILEQSNKGVSAARNLGIHHAKGQYIGFMDADDIVLPNYIQIITESIQNNVDIVEFGYKKFLNSIEDTYKKTTIYSNKNFGMHLTNKVLNEVYSKARWYPWTRVFRKQLFNDVKFPEGVRFCEDLMTIPLVYEKSNSIIVLEEALYGYRNNINSATFKIQPDYVDNLIDFYKKIPNSKAIRYQYLRLSVAFAITSCQSKNTNTWVLPKHIKNDLSKLRWSLSVYLNFEFRKLAVLLYPKTYMCFKKTFRLINNR